MSVQKSRYEPSFRSSAEIPTGFNIYSQTIPCGITRDYSQVHFLCPTDPKKPCRAIAPGENACRRDIIIENMGSKVVRDDKSDGTAVYRMEPKEKIAIVEGPAGGAGAKSSAAGGKSSDNNKTQVKTGGDGLLVDEMPLRLHNGPPPLGAVNIPQVIQYNGQNYNLQPVSNVPFSSNTTYEDGKVVTRQIYNVPPSVALNYVPATSLSRAQQELILGKIIMTKNTTDTFIPRDLPSARIFLSAQQKKVGAIEAQFTFGMQYFPGVLLKEMKNVSEQWVEYWTWLSKLFPNLNMRSLQNQSISEKEVDVVLVFKDSLSDIKIQELMDEKTGTAREWKKYQALMSTTLKQIFAFFESVIIQTHVKIDSLNISSDYHDKNDTYDQLINRLAGNYEILEAICADTGYRTYNKQDYLRPIELENGILTMLATLYLRGRAVYNTGAKNPVVPWDKFITYRSNITIEEYIRKFRSAFDTESKYFWAVDLAKSAVLYGGGGSTYIKSIKPLVKRMANKPIKRMAKK